MQTNTRVPSVPLIANDTYFSLWSPHNNLYDGDTAHWSGKRKRTTGTVCVDGKTFRFMGSCDHPISSNIVSEVIPQIALDITCTSTTYAFSNELIELKLRFTSPLLLDEPELVSRPCTYLDFTVKSNDGKPHDVTIELDWDEEHTHDSAEAEPVCGGSYTAPNYRYASMGKIKQAPLSHSGDHITIDWGTLYLAMPQSQKGELAFLGNSHGGRCAITVTLPFKNVTTETSCYVVAAYDDMASINYFGEIKRGYWTKFTPTIQGAIEKSIAQHDELIRRCDETDKDLHDRAVKAISEDYAQICALAYRQSIHAHKLIEDENGELIFLSKENDSNGCIGTVDVSYPSVPLFLLYNTDYVKGMLRPIFRFASLPAWEYDFAPHDVGRYPYATGQVYGLDTEHHPHEFCRANGSVYPYLYTFPAGSNLYDFADQMPVEECGNMLILCSVICQMDGNADFVRPYFETLEQWTQYLIKYGSDPGEQLCTDDFAGHLAHNVNLSAKAIMGIYSFALLARQLGDEASFATYSAKAKEMAADWEARAASGENTRLTFDNPNSWSLKYNLIWDVYFGSKLFSPSMIENELACYLRKSNTYGVPLDSRADYTKSDWILWCSGLTTDKEIRKALTTPILRYLNESTTRIAFGDWYDTVTGRYCHFINRTVQGGLFMPIFMDER